MGKSLRLVAYNFLAGGSAQRNSHWTRVTGLLRADIVFAQECRPPGACEGDTFVPAETDCVHWLPAGRSRVPGRTRWGSGVLVRSSKITPITFERYPGWVTGAEITHSPWLNGKRLRVFSIHVPPGKRGYLRTLHEILDIIPGFQKGADVILAGDFNVVVGYRSPGEPVRMNQGEEDLLDRLTRELRLISCWQTAHPGKPLAQTLRWSANRRLPYHCDGIFVPSTWRHSLVSCRVVSGAGWRELSDHNPVLAEFSFEEEGR